MSWFPFLFYSTTYIVDVERTQGPPSDTEAAEKVGSLGMLLFALVSIVFASLLPMLTITGDGTEASLPGTPSAVQRVSLRTMWIAGASLQALLLSATFFVRTQTQAVVLVMCMGIPWSVWIWVPFAMLGEFVRESELEPSEEAVEDQWSAQLVMDRPESRPRNSFHESWARKPPTERNTDSGQRIASSAYTPSIVSRGREVALDEGLPLEDSVRGGTILGIHNLALVLPQFAVALLASLIFRMTSTPAHGTAPGRDGDVAWVLRFGALMALGAVFLARRIPLTQSERTAWHIAPVHLPLDEDEDL